MYEDFAKKKESQARGARAACIYTYPSSREGSQEVALSQGDTADFGGAVKPTTTKDSYSNHGHAPSGTSLENSGRGRGTGSSQRPMRKAYRVLGEQKGPSFLALDLSPKGPSGGGFPQRATLGNFASLLGLLRRMSATTCAWYLSWAKVVWR